MWLSLLKLIRLPLVFTAVADPITGYFLALPGLHYANYLQLLILILISALLYSSGMALNDIMDVERDKTLHPQRVLPTSQIEIRSAVLSCAALQMTALLLAAWVGLSTLWWVILMVVCIFSYNSLAKNHSFMGSFNMAFLRFANFILGMLPIINIFAIFSDVYLWIFPVLLFFYVFFLTLISTLEEEENKKGLFLFYMVLLSLTIFSLNFFALTELTSILLTLLFICGIIMFGFSTLKEFSQTREMKMVRWLVIGIIPFDGLVCLANEHYSVAFLLLLLLIPPLLLGKMAPDVSN